LFSKTIFHTYRYWNIQNVEFSGSIRRGIKTARELGRRADADLTLPTQGFTNRTCKSTILWLV